jgi:hypothetical protein
MKNEAVVQFKVGDLVSRDGTDIHLVTAVNEAGDLIEVECVKEPLGYLDDEGRREEPWARRGERELNLTSRYQLVSRAARSEQ